MCRPRSPARPALFLVDDRGQFLANRDAGQFDDYPDPTATLGEAILAGTPRPTSGRVVVTHLGVGLADVVFADAIVRRAEAAGCGTLLRAGPRRRSSRIVIAVAVLLVVVVVASPSGSVRSPGSPAGRCRRPPARSTSRARRRGHRRSGHLRIAQITATTPHDLFLAQGYVHAQERMWQMEVWRQISAGRLVGGLRVEPLTPTASSARSAGDRPRNGTSPRSRPRRAAILEAYAEGVNAWLDANRGNLGLPSSSPARSGRTAVDGARLAHVGQGPGVEPRRQHRHELFRFLADARLGDPARTDELFPPRRGRAGHRCADRRADEPSAGERPGGRRSRDGGHGRPDAQRRPRAWRRRRRARRTLLAPRRPRHLGRRPRLRPRRSARTTGSSRPAHSEERRRAAGQRPPPGHLDAVGLVHQRAALRAVTRRARTTWPGSASPASRASSSATTPGSPGARRTSGPTSRTSSSRRSIRPTRRTTSTHGPSRPVRRPERDDQGVGRRDGRPRVRETVHGPILNDVDKRLVDSPLMALRWTAIHPAAGPDRTYRGHPRAEHGRRLRRVPGGSSGYGAPSQNFVYADVDGHIGYQMPGYMPVRSDPNDRGDRPVDGGDGTRNGPGPSRSQDLPWALDPPEGWIVSGEQRHRRPGRTGGSSARMGPGLSRRADHRPHQRPRPGRPDAAEMSAHPERHVDRCAPRDIVVELGEPCRRRPTARLSPTVSRLGRRLRRR